MPEYSSTTITPADAVQTPAMNGSTSGNYNLAALRSYILASKGQANGLASLDANGKLPSGQLPDLADDVLIYGNYALLPNPGADGKLYITSDNNKMYRWDSGTSAYVVLTVDLSAYETKAEASELKSAIVDSEQRIENLEQAVSGSLVQTNTDATQANTKTITNADEILPWALLNRVGARSTQWNQLVDSGTSSLTLTNGHKYVTVINGTATKVDGTGQSVSVTGGSDNVHDLTMMGLDSLTASQFRAKFPASYYPYNAGEIINLNPSGFDVVGKNKFDDDTILLSATSWTKSGGIYSGNCGYLYDLGKLPISFLQDKNYTISAKWKNASTSTNSLYIVVDYSDGTSESMSISSDSWAVATITATKAIRDIYFTYNTAIMVDIEYIQVEIGSSATAYEPYSKTTVSTPFLSGYKYVNSSCHDYSENVYVDGVVKRKEHTVVDSISLASLIWTESGGVYSATVNGMKSNGAVLCDKYGVSVSGTTISITTSSSPTGTLYFEKATPTSTTSDTPIPNFPCEDGTTITAVTPQTELVNAIDVPSTIAYMTKIGG